MEFSELNLHPDLQRGLNEAGYITCMPVQEQVLAHAFGGQDLYVQSQTGTGKTAAFLVVIFQRLLTEDMLHGKKAIIMVPTRELAVQVEEEARLIGKYLSFSIGSFYGGVGYTQQMAMLRDNVKILVGTPGRVLDLNQSGRMNLMDIAFLILDEADRMFDMGFYPDLRKLIKAVPPADRRQTMLFSATLNAWVKNLAWEYTRNPFEIAIEPETVTVDEVKQVLYHVSSGDKMKLLLGILKREDPESVLIFCNTKRYAEIVAKRLRINGYECEFIMGDLPQPKRLKIIDDIKAGKLRILVATDVAARGLDIESLALVVNYDLPNESENYVHRIGRTARMGKTGLAISFASEQDVYELPGIERYIGKKLPSETAVAELFDTDKSDGKRIHTEFFEERSSRDKEGPPRRRDSEKRHDRSAPVSRGHEQKKVRFDKGRVSGKNGEERGTSFRENAKDQEKNLRTGSKPDLKLSELSLEERMAYYKQKYDRSGGIQTRQNPPEPGKSPHRRDEAKHGERKRDRAGKPKEKYKGRNREQEGQAPPSPEKLERPNKRPRPEKKKGTLSTGSNNSGSNTANPVQVDSTQPKKGVLSRLRGIFKKNKE